MAKKNSTIGVEEIVADVELVADEEHPDFQAGIIADGTEETAEAADSEPLEAVSPEEIAELEHLSLPGPTSPRPPLKFPFPLKPAPPFNFCGPVSGLYRFSTFTVPSGPTPGPLPALPLPTFPFNILTVNVRVDVDRFFPQNHISVEVRQILPASTAHVVAKVTSDKCYGLNNRRIRATVIYSDGNPSLIPADELVFSARRAGGFVYKKYNLYLFQSGNQTRRYRLSFVSQSFDPVEFEVDRVANAGSAVTTYATGSHPNRPATLPNETISLQTVFQRAGFDVAMSPNATIIPTSGAGANGTWSDSEMHNAMVTFWSRFSNHPKWAMWVLYAARHDIGYGLGGIMFDDIGPNHRQGTAIFTDSFIQDVPSGDPSPAAWRQRMTFWTAVHEIGHAFNLAHSWQKAMGTPWMPLANQPEARSFMNYPFRVAGGQSSFFSDFAFRFSDEELLFMRHAPRRFVQMGNSNWFDNHGFEAPEVFSRSGRWAMTIRCHRNATSFRFMEPVNLELRLANTSDGAMAIGRDMLADGRHITIFVQREGGNVRRWRAMVTRCHEEQRDPLKAGEAIYGAHCISASTEGWLVDEPGFYKVQAAVDVGDEIVLSNVLRLYVTPPASEDEGMLAPDYFDEDVGRAITFAGAPALAAAHETLQAVTERCPDNPAARHAAVALSSPLLRDYKVLDADGDRTSMAISTQTAKIDSGADAQKSALLDDPDAAADTLGHIGYFDTLGQLVDALDEAGDEKGAAQVLNSTIETMKKRSILTAIIHSAERRLEELGQS